MTKSSQVKSKKRVTDHGEVFTAPREVNAMLDLVKDESERIDSRFLEPACGTGNFLTAILERKINQVNLKYSKSLVDWEKNGLLAVSSIYGIDILEDNVGETRALLFNQFLKAYKAAAKKTKFPVNEDVNRSVKFVLEKNIVWGDALTMKSADPSKNQEPIIFSEWSLVLNKFKRREFIFNELVNQNYDNKKNDLGEDAEVFSPLKEFKAVDYRKIFEMENVQC